MRHEDYDDLDFVLAYQEGYDSVSSHYTNPNTEGGILWKVWERGAADCATGRNMTADDIMLFVMNISKSDEVSPLYQASLNP